MNLYEYEAKELFKKQAIKVPNSQLLSSSEDPLKLTGKVIGKAQVLFGGRGKKGLVKEDYHSIFSPEVKKVLVEEFVEAESLHYLSITYDTTTRTPILLYSDQGGVEIETNTKISKQEIDLLNDKLPTINKEIDAIAAKLWEVFKVNDARLVEINPLAKTKAGWLALDAKIILDDDGLSRHPEFQFEPRNDLGRAPTAAEIAAKKIDQEDHRGSAGSSYFDLDGDIGIIAAGGGGSVVNMDALIALGGKPANYTEHSGNPPAEKVEELTKIVLSKPNLHGLWLVGATANFTDMVETLTGFVNGLRATDPKPDYPIVIRRGGPRWEEARKMLTEFGKKEGYDFHIYGPETPMTSTAKIIVDLSDNYKSRVKN